MVGPMTLVTGRWLDGDPQAWTLTFVASVGADDDLGYVEDVRAALESGGAYVGGGGAQPLYEIRLAPPGAVADDA